MVDPPAPSGPTYVVSETCSVPLLTSSNADARNRNGTSAGPEPSGM